MNLNEVDQQEEITKAGKIVQQMFHKKHQIMQWESDTKPTIRGLIAQLDDPFLLSLTKDLNYFLNYGQKYVDLNTNDIFKKTTDLPTYDDMMKDPEYFANKKSTASKIVKMHPGMYAVHCKNSFKGIEGRFTPEPELVQEYALRVLDGSKMPLPYLRYEYVEDERRGNYTSFGQEGRHRATVAEMLSASSMPVLVVAGFERVTDDVERVRKYQERIWSKF